MSPRDKPRSIGALVPFVGDATVRLEGVELAWTLPVVAVSHEALLVRSPESSPAGSLVHLELTTGADLVQGMGEVAGVRPSGDGHEILIQLLFVDEQSRSVLRRLVSESEDAGVAVEWSGARAPAGAQAPSVGEAPPPAAERPPAPESPRAGQPAPGGEHEPAPPLEVSGPEADSAKSVPSEAGRGGNEAAHAGREPSPAPSGWTLDPIDPGDVAAVDLGQPSGRDDDPAAGGGQALVPIAGEGAAGVVEVVEVVEAGKGSDAGGPADGGKVAKPARGAGAAPPGASPGEAARDRAEAGVTGGGRTSAQAPDAGRTPAAEAAAGSALASTGGDLGRASDSPVDDDPAGGWQRPTTAPSAAEEASGLAPTSWAGEGEEGPASGGESSVGGRLDGGVAGEPVGGRRSVDDGEIAPWDVDHEFASPSTSPSRSRVWLLPALLLIVAFAAAAWWTRDAWLGRSDGAPTESEPESEPARPSEAAAALADAASGAAALPPSGEAAAAGEEVEPGGEEREPGGAAPPRGESAPPPAPAVAQQRDGPLELTGVDVQDLRGETRVTVSLSGPVAGGAVSSFGLPTPPRYVVRLTGVAGAGSFSAGTPELTRVRVGLHQGANGQPETHLVFDLAALGITGSFTVSGSTIEVRLVNGG
ncbi:MAG TPA: PilZ domain-containing protein [Thermoanaerobaculia bacterium]|nr:PilZ domain-containing protein [Thermoanaerobaculia bacterium]